MLTLHVVWSVGSSVALAEGLAGGRWREPWLHLPGLVVTSALLLLGCAFTTVFTLRTFPFVASIGQFAAVAVIVLAAIVAAFVGFRGSRHGPPDAGNEAPGHPGPRAPSSWLVLAAALVLSSLFQIWFGYAPRHSVNAALALAGMLALEAVAVVLFALWSSRAGWGPAHALAAAAGAILTYGWVSLRRFLVSGGTSLGVPTTPIDVMGQTGLLLLMLALCYLSSRRLRR